MRPKFEIAKQKKAFKFFSRRDSLKLINLQFLSYFATSAIGLGIDLAVFIVAVNAGARLSIANALSSTIAVIAMYFLVSGLTFPSRRDLFNFLTYATWFSLSVATYSVAIEFLALWTGLAPYVSKLALTPVSFGLNFLFNRVLFYLREKKTLGVAQPPKWPKYPRDCRGENNVV